MPQLLLSIFLFLVCLSEAVYQVQQMSDNARRQSEGQPEAQLRLRLGQSDTVILRRVEDMSVDWIVGLRMRLVRQRQHHSTALFIEESDLFITHRDDPQTLLRAFCQKLRLSSEQCTDLKLAYCEAIAPVMTHIEQLQKTKGNFYMEAQFALANPLRELNDLVDKAAELGLYLDRSRLHSVWRSILNWCLKCDICRPSEIMVSLHGQEARVPTGAEDQVLETLSQQHCRHSVAAQPNLECEIEVIQTILSQFETEIVQAGQPQWPSVGEGEGDRPAFLHRPAALRYRQPIGVTQLPDVYTFGFTKNAILVPVLNLLPDLQATAARYYLNIGPKTEEILVDIFLDHCMEPGRVIKCQPFGPFFDVNAPLEDEWHRRLSSQLITPAHSAALDIGDVLQSALRFDDGSLDFAKEALRKLTSQTDLADELGWPTARQRCSDWECRSELHGRLTQALFHLSVLPATDMWGPRRRFGVERPAIEHFLQVFAHLAHGKCLEWGRRYDNLFLDHCSVKETFQYEEDATKAAHLAGQLIRGNLEDLVGVVEDNYYDTVVCTQVFEHIRRPFRAIAELFRIVAPGGTVLFTVPHISRFHKDPSHDYWRFTHEGAVELVTSAGFRVQHVYTPGVQSVLAGALSGYGVQDPVKVWGLDQLTQESRWYYHTVCLVLVKPLGNDGDDAREKPVVTGAPRRNDDRREEEEGKKKVTGAHRRKKTAGGANSRTSSKRTSSKRGRPLRTEL